MSNDFRSFADAVQCCIGHEGENFEQVKSEQIFIKTSYFDEERMNWILWLFFQ